MVVRGRAGACERRLQLFQGCFGSAVRMNSGALEHDGREGGVIDVVLELIDVTLDAMRGEPRVEALEREEKRRMLQADALPQGLLLIGIEEGSKDRVENGLVDEPFVETRLAHGNPGMNGAHMSRRRCREHRGDLAHGALLEAVAQERVRAGELIEKAPAESVGEDL